METRNRHRRHEKMAKWQCCCLYVFAFILISIPFIFVSGLFQPACAAGGEVVWQIGDTPQAGKQEAHAMALDSAGSTIITGYSDQLGTEDYFTLRIEPGGGAVAAGWPKTYDNSGGIDHAEAVAVDSSDNIIVTGQAQNASGNYDFHTIKYDSSGVVLWEKSFDAGIGGNDFAAAIAIDASDNIYIGGYTLNASINDDFIVVKYSSGGGDPVWQKSYDGPANGEDRIISITAGVDGIAVTGESQNAALNFDCVTIKYDFDGNEVWSSEKRYEGPGSNDDRCQAVRMDSAGDVIVTATTFGTNMDIYLAKYDGSVGPGTLLWEKTYDGGNKDETSKLFIDSSDNVYVTGYHTFVDGSNGIYTVKYDSGGTFKWDDVFHSSENNNDRSVSIAVDDSGDLFLTGYTFDNSSGYYDFQTIKYTKETGNLLWQETFNGTSNMNDRPVGISLTSSGDVIVAGWSEVAVNDYDYYAIKYKKGLLNRPTDLGLTVFSTTRIDLLWTDNSSNETGFKIERKEGDAGGWVEIYVGITEGEISYADSPVNSETKYYYRVRAYNAGNDSNYSNEVYAVTSIQTYTPHIWKYTFDNMVDNEDKVAAVAVGPDYHPNVTGHSYSIAGTFDYYTVKLDRQSGNDLWNARHDGDQNDLDMATTIAVDGNNDVLVSGWSYLYSIAADENTNDIYTLKYPSTGPPEDWNNQYSGPAGDDDRSSVVDVSTDGLNKYVVVGYGRNVSGNDDIYVIKYDTDGIIEWAATPYDRGYNDYPVSASFGPSGSVIVSGYSSNGSDFDFFTAKYDSNGNLDTSWSVNPVIHDSTYGQDIAKAMVLDPAGNIYVTGQVTNINGDSDFYTIKYNGADGSIATGWPKTYNGYADGFDESVGIGLDPVTGEVVVAGTTYTVNGENDFHVIRYDSDGNVVWQRTLDRPDNDDFAVAMDMDLSGNVYITGDTYNAESPTSGWDVLSVQYDHTGSFINGTIVNGTADDSDGASSIAVNGIGEVFIGGYEFSANYDADYLVFKLAGDELQVPIPFEAVVHYITVDFTWVDNSEDETSYQLQRNDAPGSCDSTWSDIYNAGGTEFTDDNGGAGLAWGTTYCYRIRTYKDIDEYSRWVGKTITTMDLLTPAGLTATQLNTSEVYLTWTDTTTSENIFNIERCDAAGLNCPGSDFAEVGEAPADAQSYTDTTACEGTEYYYRINAQKTGVPGWTSGYSNETNTTTDSITAPAGLTATWISEVQIDLLWNNNSIDETGFRIERCLTSSCTFTQINEKNMDPAIVMLLNMDEGGWLGTTDEVVDSSGSGNSGTASNGATTVSDGMYGYAGSFDGDDDYVEVQNSTALNILDELTIELWFRPLVTYDSSLTDYVVLLDRQWDAGTDSYFLAINSAGKLHMGTNGGSIQSTQTTWTAGQWYHVVVTYRDMSGVYSGEMYIDGVSETLSVDSYDNMSGGTQKIGIGGSDRFNNFAGAIDRVAVYNRALTVTEANDRFNNIFRYSDSGVPDVNENYTYRVRAYKTAVGCAGGEWNSAYSATASDDSTISAPTGLTASAINTTRIDLSWTDNTASETGYRIFRCAEPCIIDYGNDELIVIGEMAGQGETVTYSDGSVCQATTYKYSVIASNNLVPWNSTPSNEVAATTDTGYAPDALSLKNITESQAELEWTDNTGDETGYRIERCKNTLENCTNDFVVDGTTTVVTMPSDNVMLLHMDEALWNGTTGEVIDDSGSGNNGRAYNQANTDAGGQIERAGIFDGSGDYVSVPHSSSLEGSGDFTLELWIKPIDQNNWQGMISKGGYRYLFALNDSGSNFRLAYYGSGWQYANSWTPYNVWTHIAVVFDGTNSITFYLNGQPDGTRTIAGNQASTSTLQIGQWGNNYWYEGLMDEVAIYDRALTGEEITARYYNGKQALLEGTATNTVSSATTIEDSSKTWTVNEWTDYYVFMETGANTGEARLITSNASNSLTVGVPFANDVVNGDVYKIVRVVNGTDTTGLLPDTTYIYRVSAYKTAAGCAGGEWSSDASDLLEVSTTVPQDPTALLATTIDTTEIRLDWDDNTTSETDFEVERKCLSGGDDCPVPDVWSRVNIDGDPGPNLTDNAAYSDDTVCENTTYEYRVNAKKGTDWVTGWSDPVAQTTTDDYIIPSGLTATTVTEEQIDITWIDNTTDETSFRIERCDKAAINCVENDFSEIGTLGTTYGDLLIYHMDEASWGTVIDSSEGGSNSGTAYGGATTDPGGRFGRAGSFNGTSQYVITPVNLNQSSSSPGVTMAAWVKPDSVSSGWHHVISTDDDGVEWSLVRYGNTWRVLTGNTNFNSGFSVDVGEWQHIAAVFTPGVGITVYKNGAASSTVSIAYNSDDRNVMIGRRARDSNYYFDGLIDEVALYNTPLSFIEIYQLADDEWKEDTGDIEDGSLSQTTIQDTDKAWADDEWIDYYVVMVTGPIAGESRKIVSNTSDILTVEAFSALPDVGDTYNIITYLKGNATGGTTTTVEDSGKNWVDGEWVNYYVVMETGANAGESRRIISSTSTVLTVEGSGPFGTAIVSGNAYKILPYLQGAQSYGTKDTGDASGGSSTTVIDSSKAWTTNEWAGFYVLMETGLNSDEISRITSNTSDTLTVGTAFSNVVSSGDSYKIVTSQSYTKRFSDTGLAIGQTYTYRVRGYKNSPCAWPVEYSNTAESTISPPAPTNLTATAAGTTQIALEWTDNTGTETGFKIMRCNGACTPVYPGDFFVEVPGEAGTGIRSYYDTSVAPGVCESSSYSYSIFATSDSPAWDSDLSNIDTATTATANAPTDFTVTPVAESRTDLSWSDNTDDETGFKIVRCEAPCTPDVLNPDHLLATIEPDFTTFSDTVSVPDTTYNYQVHTYKTATCAWDKYDSASELSSSITAPVLTATTVSTTRIDLDWTDNTESETGFVIESCEGSSGCAYTELATVGPDVTTYSDISLCNTETFTYRVKAVNDGLSNNGGGCWTRRAKLSITDFVPNHQTKVEITAYDTDMQPDFDDIRFYDATAGLEVPYWIESKTDGDSATLYIKTLVHNDIYMYYGNPAAASSSNADKVYEFYDDFTGTTFDTAKWEEIDPNNSLYQSDKLVLNDAGSDAWTKALISQQTFERVDGKEVYISLTPFDTSGNNYFMAGWELNQNTNPSYNQLVHGMYWSNSAFTTYEKGGNKSTNGSYGYSWSTPYEMKIVLYAAGAKYYIKGGAYTVWTLMQDTPTYSDSPLRIAFTQHSHRADINVIKIQHYSPVEPSVLIGTEEQDDNCYTFSTWVSPPYSNEATDTTMSPLAPSNLTAVTVSDTRTDLSWTDNTEDETGFRVERCLGTVCTPSTERATVQGLDTSISMLLRMDESSWHGISGEVLDSAGSNNGTAYNGANTTAGGFERSGSFDGTSDYVIIPDNAGINPTDEITLALWAMSDTSTWNASGTLASKRNAYILYPVSGSKEIRFYVYTTLQWYYTSFTPTIDITGWHHYAGTYDGNEIKLYIDGVPVGTPTLRMGGINADPGPLYIGRDDGTSSYFKGLIDEVAIYGSALSDSEVQALYNQGVPSKTKYSDTVTPSVSYCYQVRAYKTAAGCPGGEWNSGYSDVTCTETPPATPSNLNVTAQNSIVVSLGWDGSGVDNELGFEIERRIWGGTFINIATVGPDINVYNDIRGIEPEEEYTYRIRAYNSEGVSDYSNEDSDTTPSWQEGDHTCFE